ncbi:MAG: hypothetical protein AMXMBFR61_17370 [Fimbriimonadales bacterium]
MDEEPRAANYAVLVFAGIEKRLLDVNDDQDRGILVEELRVSHVCQFGAEDRAPASERLTMPMGRVPVGRRRGPSCPGAVLRFA